MEDHMKRVVVEYREINEKLAKLTAFNKSPRYSELDHDRRLLLLEQEGVMLRYSDILRKRLALEGIEVTTIEAEWDKDAE